MFIGCILIYTNVCFTVLCKDVFFHLVIWRGTMDEIKRAKQILFNIFSRINSLGKSNKRSCQGEQGNVVFLKLYELRRRVKLPSLVISTKLGLTFRRNLNLCALKTSPSSFNRLHELLKKTIVLRGQASHQPGGLFL